MPNALSLAMSKATKDLQLNANSDGVHNSEEQMVDPNTDDDNREDYTSVKGTGEEDSGMNLTRNFNSDVTEVSSGNYEAEIF